MAQKITLALEPRTLEGKQMRALRASGHIPAVIYGAAIEAQNVQAISGEIEKVVRAAGRHHIVEATLSGKKQTVLIKAIDIDPVKHKLRHVAFHAVSSTETVTTEIPVLLEGIGESKAERAGLMVLQAIDNVEVSALPADLPDNLPVSVLDLENAGDRLTVGDLVLPRGVEFTHPEDVLELVIANVYEPSALQAANEAAGGDAVDAESDVPADKGTEDTSEPQGQESRPGGKGQLEPKQSNVDAAKEDK